MIRLSWPRAFLVIIAIKILLASLSPMDSEFRNLLREAASFASGASKGIFHYHGVYTLPIFFQGSLYKLWLLIPVDHPSLQQLLVSGPTLSLMLFTVISKSLVISADIGIAFLLRKILFAMFNDKAKANFCALLWLANPYHIIFLDMAGAHDVIPAFLTLASVYCFWRERIVLSGSLLAVAAIYRLYPLVLIPVYIAYCVREHNNKKLFRFLIPVIASVVLVLGWLSIYGIARAFQLLMEIPLRHVEVTWFFGFKMNASSYKGPDAFLSAVILAYFAQLVAFKVSWRSSIDVLWRGPLALLLTFFGLSDHWPNFFTWTLPYMYLDIFRKRVSRIFPVALYLGLIGTWAIFVNPLYPGDHLFFVPFFNEEMKLLASIFDTQRYMNNELLAIFAASLYSAATLSYLFFVNGEERLNVKANASKHV